MEENNSATDIVIRLAASFTARWRHLGERYPKYRLDLTWPSVGTLDLLLRPLRGRKEFSPQEREYLNAAAAYLALLTHYCWSSLSEETSISFSLGESDSREAENRHAGDVSIQAIGGQYLPEEATFRVNISQALRQILSTPRDPFPYFAAATCQLQATTPIVRLFALGLFSGLCPYGEGLWRRSTAVRAREMLGRITAFLSASTAQYYKSVFPSEPLGADPTLYIHNLILPPVGHLEEFPAITAVTGLHYYLQEQKIPRLEMAKLLLNLVALPDDTVSFGARAMILGLCNDSAPEDVQFFNRADPITVELRAATILARSLTSGAADWIKLIESKDNVGAVQTAQALYATEFKLGLLSHVLLPPHLLSDPTLRELFRFLAWADTDAATEAIDLLISQGHPQTSHLLVQGAFLQFSADLAGCLDKFSRLQNLQQDLPPAELALVFMLSALIQQRAGNFLEAMQAFENSLRLADDERLAISAVGSLRCKVLLGQHQSAATAGQHYLQRYPGVSTLSLLRNVALLALDEPDQAALSLLVSRLPFNGEVFSLALAHVESELT